MKCWICQRSFAIHEELEAQWCYRLWKLREERERPSPTYRAWDERVGSVRVGPRRDTTTSKGR